MSDPRHTAPVHEHSPRQNELLAELSDSVQQRLLPHLELVYLPFGRVLLESGVAVRNVYFPADALIALLCLLENGDANEVSVVGHEGVVGTCAFMGGDSSLRRAVVECPGFAYRLSKQRLIEEFDRHGELLQVLLRHVGSMVTQVGQIAVCNRHHSVEQQLCRWLLLCLDRVPERSFAMTHGVMADMLGVRRESVSSAAAHLRERGLIEYQRGHLTVLDRGKLEALTRECYQVIHASTRLYPHAHDAALNAHRLPPAHAPGSRSALSPGADRTGAGRPVLQEA